MHQPLTTSLAWKQCEDLPIERSIEQCTVIKGRVYLSGQGTRNEEDRYVICCYDPGQDRWDTLPPLPVQYYGLGQVNDKPVVVGGKKKDSPGRTNEVYTFDENSQAWTHTIPNMPTGQRQVTLCV